MMHTERDTCMCRSRENEESRNSHAGAAMTTQDEQRDHRAPAEPTRPETPPSRRGSPVRSGVRQRPGLPRDAAETGRLP